MQCVYNVSVGGPQDTGQAEQDYYKHCLWIGLHGRHTVRSFNGASTASCLTMERFYTLCPPSLHLDPATIQH